MSHGGSDFEQALLAAETKLGYVMDAFILNAVHWTPQSRVRMFVLAELDAGQDRVTAAFISDARPAAPDRFHRRSWRDHAGIFAELPPLPKPTKQLKDIVEDLPDNDVHW